MKKLMRSVASRTPPNTHVYDIPTHCYIITELLAAAWLSWKSAGLVIERLRNLGSTSDVVARRCGHEKHLMLFSILVPSSLPVVVVQLDEWHANRTTFVLEWYDRHRAIQLLV